MTLGKYLKILDPNKAHGHDMMSIPILKMCKDFINKLLRLIFRASFRASLYARKNPMLCLFIKNDKHSIIQQ